jgi:hypothetical protein
MNELMMTEESPVKVIDEDLTKYHFQIFIVFGAAPLTLL